MDHRRQATYGFRNTLSEFKSHDNSRHEFNRDVGQKSYDNSRYQSHRYSQNKSFDNVRHQPDKYSESYGNSEELSHRNSGYTSYGNSEHQSSEYSRYKALENAEYKSYGSSRYQPSSTLDYKFSDYPHHSIDTSRDFKDSDHNSRFQPHRYSQNKSYGNVRQQPDRYSELDSHGNSEHQSSEYSRHKALENAEYKSYGSPHHQSSSTLYHKLSDYPDHSIDTLRHFQVSDHKSYNDSKSQYFDRSRDVSNNNPVMKQDISSLRIHPNPCETQTSRSFLPKSDQPDFLSMRRDTFNNKRQIDTGYQEEEYNTSKMQRYESESSISKKSPNTWQSKSDQSYRDVRACFDLPHQDEVRVNDQFGHKLLIVNGVNRHNEDQGQPSRLARNLHDITPSVPIDDYSNTKLSIKTEPEAPRFFQHDSTNYSQTKSISNNSVNQLELKTEKDKYRPEQLVQMSHTAFTISTTKLIHLLRELVICYFVSEKGVPMNKKDNFNVINESFMRSNISKPDFQYGTSNQTNFCLVFWEGNLLLKVSGGGEDSLRKRTLQLLRERLVECCYSIKPNFNFFGKKGLDMKMSKREIHGLFRVVTRKDAPTAEDAVTYIDNFFKVDTDCELVFPRKEEFTVIDFQAIKEYVTAKGLDYICDVNHMTVFVRRTPQYWRDKILASGKAHNDKYFICPPTSRLFVKILNDPLLQKPVSVPQLNVPEKSGVQQNETVLCPTEEYKQQCLERIKDIQEKYAGKKHKISRKQCMRSIADEKVRMGIPLNEIRELQFLGRKRMKRAQRMQIKLANKNK